MEDLFKLQYKLEVNHSSNTMAMRLQKWWREKLRKWKISYKQALIDWKACLKI